MTQDLVPEPKVDSRYRVRENLRHAQPFLATFYNFSLLLVWRLRLDCPNCHESFRSEGARPRGVSRPQPPAGAARERSRLAHHPRRKGFADAGRCARYSAARRSFIQLVERGLARRVALWTCNRL